MLYVFNDTFDNNEKMIVSWTNGLKVKCDSIIVEGQRGIITALKNISQKALDRLTKNYNWR